MSIDNNAILFLGLPIEEIPQVAEFKDRYGEDDFDRSISETLNQIDTGLGYRDDFQHDDWDILVGFQIGDSEAYGSIVIENPLALINEATCKFQGAFKMTPQLYLFSYRS